jgi:hypothetical protein
MRERNLTPGNIDKHYMACMDSVALINRSKPDGVTDEVWSSRVERNKKHLQLMLNKDFWTDEYDLQPLRDAIGV